MDMDEQQQNDNPIVTPDPALAPSDVIPRPDRGTQKEVEKETEHMEAKANEYLAGWQRAKADYANLQRESDAKLSDLRKYAAAGFINELLPVIDTFTKAMEKPPEDAGAKQWVEGIGHIRGQLEKVLAKHGVSVIAETGVPFDANVHEAMLQQPADGAPPGTVVQILEPGYRMHDRVLRPAKVVVAE
jgi:molecular chaperone GrpE